MFGEGFGLGGVGIELEDAGDVGAGFIELAGVAGDVGKVHADGATAGGAIEGGIPKRDGTIVVTSACFDDSEICGGVDQCWICLQRVLVEFARLGVVAAALGDEGQTIEQDGVIGMFEDGLIDVALGFDGGGAMAFLCDGLPCESEIAGIAGGRAPYG